ncbi:MAG: bifunctional 5,10-methylenetetrahydrofolate dehydrogenase/5,10-methenyltetrahydrofolate cyclohydrolase [Elusimicrobia bacterium]|nr:bifunctional 5,10-methylenetetrahydrofolate dehydrogenase/5,10-methenyltetrahydrofolate cyclohydrolase [Elusimicrobiota bacterium]
MNARLDGTSVFDCQAVADRHLDWVRAEVPKFPSAPCLATLLFRPAADQASTQYRDLILKDAQRLGLAVRSIEAADPEALRGRIEEANHDPDIHGVLVLYPLKAPVADEDVMDWVSPYKDTEGLHSINLGYLIKFKKFLDAGREIKCVVPATAKAVVKTLQHYPEIQVSGRFVTVVNNSMRVGKPLGLMLENLGATVVKCYHLTRPEDIESCVRRADILVTAVPDPSFRLKAGWVKPGAAVLDVSHSGNLDMESLQGRAAWVTTPQNRLGKVTRAMIFVNLIYCARYKGLFY